MEIILQLYSLLALHYLTMHAVSFILATVIIQAATGASPNDLTASSQGGTTIKPVLTAEAPGAHKAEVAPESAITGASDAQYAWPHGYFGLVNSDMSNMVATAPPPEGGTEPGDALEAQREYNLDSQQNAGAPTMTLPQAQDPYGNWPGLYGPVPVQPMSGPMMTTMHSGFGTPPGMTGMGQMAGMGASQTQNGPGAPEAATEANDAQEAFRESTAASIPRVQNAVNNPVQNGNPYHMTRFANQNMYGDPNMMPGNPPPPNPDPNQMNSNPNPMNNNPNPMNGYPNPMNGNPNPMNNEPNQMNGNPDQNQNNNNINPFQRFYETYLNMLFGPLLNKNFMSGTGSSPMQNPWLTSYLFREMF